MKIELQYGAFGERIEHENTVFTGAWCRINATYTAAGHTVQTSYFYDELTPGFVALHDRPQQFCTIDGIPLRDEFYVSESGRFFVKNNNPVDNRPGHYKQVAAVILTAAHETFDAEARARKMALEKMEISAPA
jgi:hypothetical protein